MWVLVALAADAGLTPPQREADAEAMRRMAEGDATGLAELYDRHGRALFSLAFRILRDQGDAEEVVQDVFAQAWRQAARYDTSRGVVVAWLLMMTRSRAIDRVRLRRGRPGLREDHPDVLRDLSDEGDGIDLALLTQEQVVRVRAALDELPATQRLAIELAFYEGLTHSEVAERLEQPLGTVKTRIRLGLLRLRAAFGGGQP
ncbi:MAG TPA: sigma-70 family RNA polymerase sigma factor [Luteitalea sp.]|nr:sigma-70 family RNA polymerase sigma factor [Luteitalea sp.]